MGCAQRRCKSPRHITKATLQSLKKDPLLPSESLPSSWMDTLSENINKAPQNKKLQFLITTSSETHEVRLLLRATQDQVFEKVSEAGPSTQVSSQVSFLR